MMGKHQLHRRYKFIGRRGKLLVWESRAHSWLTGHWVDEITCDADWFYGTMEARYELAQA